MTSRKEILQEINRLPDNSSEEDLSKVLRLIRKIVSENSGKNVNSVSTETILSSENELLKRLDTDQHTGKPSNPPE